jgi:hypothetical protein
MSKKIKNYNGWTNYATWRINLEIFADMDAEKIEEAFYAGRLYMEPITSTNVKQYVLDFLFGSREFPENAVEHMVESYARSFLNQVNWYEISTHLNFSLWENLEHEFSQDSSLQEEYKTLQDWLQDEYDTHIEDIQYFKEMAGVEE